MGKTTAKAVFGVAALYLLSALPTLAADLILKVDNVKKSVAVTNTLPTKLTLLYLQGLDDRNLALFAHLDKGATVNVPLHFVMPAAVGPAVCEVGNQRRFLTVELK
ncbi:MAG: hypothetical protein CO126_10350 [Hydrogenophilales bacterium CG_4_9_14_3_um_filter_63_34]|nr:MAG: hypothetical protein COZ24_04570 [Hydrogenophilales bacterium CG_4_10_14_3_um_filter_63_21]PJB02767.1 MAG: hypothetical protein CO126_10350 [Hydrogenophilales bacterium CG_4_9_14_3_um_filter_63_34]